MRCPAKRPLRESEWEQANERLSWQALIEEEVQGSDSPQRPVAQHRHQRKRQPAQINCVWDTSEDTLRLTPLLFSFLPFRCLFFFFLCSHGEPGEGLCWTCQISKSRDLSVPVNILRLDQPICMQTSAPVRFPADHRKGKSRRDMNEAGVEGNRTDERTDGRRSRVCTLTGCVLELKQGGVRTLGSPSRQP